MSKIKENLKPVYIIVYKLHSDSEYRKSTHSISVREYKAKESQKMVILPYERRRFKKGELNIIQDTIFNNSIGSISFKVITMDKDKIEQLKIDLKNKVEETMKKLIQSSEEKISNLQKNFAKEPNIKYVNVDEDI